MKELRLDQKANTSMIGAFLYLVVLIPTSLVIVYAFAPAISAVLGMWGTLDESNKFYSESLFNTVTWAFDGWHMYVIITVAVAFLYLIVLAIRKQTYSEVDQNGYNFR